MELKTYFAQDASGNIMPGATVTVYEAGTATLATGLQDESGSPLANPFTADSSAKVAFYAPDGLYDITVVGNGRTVTIRAQFVSVDGAGVLRGDLAATGGSALVWFQQAGFGAVGRTVQDKGREAVSTADHGTVAQSLAAAAGGALDVLGAVTISSAADPAADTTISGRGLGSQIGTTTTNHHIVTAIAGGTLVRDVALSGVKGATVLNNSAVVLSGAHSAVDRVEAFGMSGMAVYLTNSSDMRVAFSHVHSLTPDSGYINGADVGLYTDNAYGQVLYNTLEGGADTECGVLLQLNSVKNLVNGNTVKAHRSYGVIDYDITARRTNSIITQNRIEDIDGSMFGGSKGAGIYAVSTGGQIVGFNHVSNTNIGTTAETLAPGAIGVNSPVAPMAVGWNMVDIPNWYGLMLVSSTTASTNWGGNVVTEAKKGSVYIKSSSHANVHGGVYEQLTATPLTARAVAVNVAGGGPFTGVSVHGNRIRGSNRGIEVGFTNNALVNSNNISEVNGIGIRLAAGCVGVACVGNVVDVTTGSGAALDVSNVTYATISGNVFKGTATTLINFAGTCTGTRFDKSNVLIGMGVNNINNAATGCIVEVYGTAPPTVLNHQPGDRVVNSAPAVGQPKAWSCTVAGVPGTWVSEGNL